METKLVGNVTWKRKPGAWVAVVNCHELYVAGGTWWHLSRGVALPAGTNTKGRPAVATMQVAAAWATSAEPGPCATHAQTSESKMAALVSRQLGGAK